MCEKCINFLFVENYNKAADRANAGARSAQRWARGILGYSPIETDDASAQALVVLYQKLASGTICGVRDPSRGTMALQLLKLASTFGKAQARDLSQRSLRAGVTHSTDHGVFEAAEKGGMWKAPQPPSGEKAMLLAERLREAESESPNWQTTLLKVAGFSHAEANAQAGRVIPEREWRAAARRPA